MAGSGGRLTTSAVPLRSVTVPPSWGAATLSRSRVAHPAMAAARAETYAVAERAQSVLDALPDSDAKTALRALAAGVVSRVS